TGQGPPAEPAAYAGDRLGESGRSESAQADLQHDGVVDGRNRRAAVGIVLDVVDRDGETIVDVAEPGAQLIDLLGYEVEARGAEQGPVRRELHGRAAEQAVATGQKADVRLSRVVSVERRQRPAIEVD